MDLLGSIPVTWTKDDLVGLRFIDDYHKDPKLNDLYISAGHDYERMKIGLLQEHMGLPHWAKSVKDNFNLDSMTTTIHRLKPGCYLPIHSDLYGTYRKLHASDGKKIARIIVFLEDWQPGHMLDVEGVVYNQWSAGDHVGWTNDTPHAAYNFGLVNRYTLQITGTI